MPIIKSISELEKNSNEISELARQSKEPIFLTKNGQGDMVIMSMTYYSDMLRKIELYSKLAEAQGQIKAGEKGKPLKEVLQNIRNEEAKKEREAWVQISMKGLENAYGDDEVEYSLDLIKKPNPDYDTR